MSSLRATLAKLDAVSDVALLWINMALACLVAVAHGGALALAISKPGPETEGIRQLTVYSLPISALFILSSGAALLRSKWRPAVLSAQGFLLAGAALVALGWAATLAIYGITQENFSWSVGLLSVFTCYAFLLFRRFTLPRRLGEGSPAYYLPVVALLVAIPVDVGVFARLSNS